MENYRKVSLETVDYFNSYIFEGFITEITEHLQKTFTDKNDDEIRELMDIWWDSLEIHFGDEELEKEGCKPKPEHLDNIKKLHKVLIEDVWESQNNFIGEGEDMFDWMWEMEWGISQYGKSIRGHKISFKDDDERSELLSDSLEQILDPSLTYIKGELVD